jgi:hypothetical protein
MDWESSEYDPESEIMEVAMETAYAFHSLKTIYPKACFAVGENRCGLIQIRQNEEPPFYLFLCPAFKKPSRKPEGHILVSLAEDAEDEDSEGGWNLSDGFEYSQLLCKLNDLE